MRQDHRKNPVTYPLFPVHTGRHIRIICQPCHFAVYDIRIRFFSGTVHNFEHIRLNPVVRVHKTDIFPFGMSNSHIPGRCGSAVFLIVILKVGMFIDKIKTDFYRVVRRAVIYQKYLYFLQGLCCNTFQTFRKVFFHIIDRYNHTDFRFHYTLLFRIRFFSFTSISTVFLAICSVINRLFRSSSPIII